MIFHNAYCQKEFLDFIIEDTSKHENEIVFKLLDQFCDLNIDVDEETFTDLIENHEIYKRFIKRESGSFNTYSYFESFKEFDANDFVTSHGNDYLFFQDKFIDTTVIREESGCNIYSINDLSLLLEADAILGYTFKKHPGRSTYKNWGVLLDKKVCTPINSMIIIDNYLYKSPNEYADFKLDNLYTIIKKIYPENLKIPFELLIILDNRTDIIKKEYCEVIIEEIHSFMAKSKDELKIGIMTIAMNEEVHQRAILSNNFFLSSDKGFNVIKDALPVKPTHGEYKWYYSSIRNHTGDITKYRQNDYLNDLNNLKEKNKSTAEGHKFNVGHVDNRLFGYTCS